YNNRFYVFPQLGSCGWAGLAYVSFGLAYSNGYNTLGVYGHELGHNFGLLHAGSLRCAGQAPCTGGGVAEYGDPFDIMGNINAGGTHFNAAQKSILNWIPLTSVKTHSGGTATYTLSPIESPGGATYAVKIPAASNRTYWIEYRQPIGFDSALAAYPNNGAQIRVSSPFESVAGADDTELLDMTPATGTFTDAALVAGQSYTDSTYGVTVTVGTASPGALSVTVSSGSGSQATTTTLTSNPNPSPTGTSTTFTATVSGNAPTGTVNFKDGASSIGGCSAAALSGSGNNKTATCSTSGLAVGTHSITASYSGDANNLASTSAALSQTVSNIIQSSTTVASSLNPSTSGSAVTFTATVTGAPGLTGSVNFTDGVTSIGNCSAVQLPAGAASTKTASCATSTLTVATHTIHAFYGGDANNVPSNATLSQVVNAGGLTATTTTLASSNNPSTFGGSVTLTATVTGSGPTGSVNFKDGGSSIGGCSAVALSGSGNTKTAACTVSGLAVATHSITAAYGGDGGNAASTSAALSQVVNKAVSTTAVISSKNPSTSGAGVTFTATVTGIAPTGSVNFKDGAASIAGCSAMPLSGSGNSRTATCTTSTLSVATHSITAAYGGDGNNAASTSATLSQVVNSAGPTGTTTTLASSSNPSTFNSSVTFTATVTGSGPTGSVNFKDGGSSIGGCSAMALSGSGNSRTAACTTTTLSVATHSITAAYGGDAGNAASTSAALSQVVNSAGSSINVALASNGGVATASSSYSAAYPVSAINNNDRAGTNWGNGGGWNDGTRAVFPDWVQINFNGSKTIDRVVVYTLQDNYPNPVEPSDTMTFTTYGITDFTVQGWNGSSWVALGSVSGNNLVKRTVSFAAYTTDRIRINVTGALLNYSRITEVEAWGTAAAGPPTSTTTLASSPNPATVGTTVNFTATVSGASPTGSVNFKDGASSIAGCSAMPLSGSGNTRTAQCPTSALTSGTHSVTAAYAGDSGNAASTSVAVSQVVNSGGGGAINVALASNGGVASASSSYSAGYPVAAINDNQRAGVNWGNGGGWNDATAGVFPDWVQINFGASRTIDHVVVYTLQDNYTNPIEPTDSMTFSLYGITAFTVQAKQGSKWTMLGSVSGNNLVKRTVSFAPLATTSIRITVTGALSSFSRITEVEAWGN
ncbi:MAG TPA: Ig-like domain repeat protein, partial [Casimicrobiaceae bacterium]|nr:Ig-like domain repeat protein [Casimicrobiaceae bacterium]